MSPTLYPYFADLFTDIFSDTFGVLVVGSPTMTPNTTTAPSPTMTPATIRGATMSNA